MKASDLFAENIACIEQALNLLRKIDAEDYRRCSPEYLGSSFGGHCRHVIDHYRQLLEGMEEPFLVDYDARERGTEIEFDPGTAERAFEEINAGLTGLRAGTPLSTPCRVRANASSEDPSEWQVSTIGRELQFVLSHSVHHFAILAIMCRQLGIVPGEGFGLAPSTVLYQRKEAEKRTRLSA